MSTTAPASTDLEAFCARSLAGIAFPDLRFDEGEQPHRTAGGAARAARRGTS